MGGEFFGDSEMEEVLPSMWPDDVGSEARNQFNVEKPGLDRDMFEDVTIIEEPTIVDFKRLMELTNYSEKGSYQLAYLVKNWEYKQANAVRLLHEELNNLSKQRREAEQKKMEILEAHLFEEERYGDKRTISVLDEVFDIWDSPPRRRNDFLIYDRDIDIDAEYDSIKYWKERAMQLDKMLEDSVRREEALMQKLQESIKSLETQSSPVEELSQILKRADNFLHFILQNAPVVIGHQDKELRYRFIYNHFPSLDEEDIIGKTDTEIFTGAGVRESQEFKKEVMERGLPAKREITFETELFGAKTFLIYVEPVFSKAGDTIGVNYMGMDITDQVIKREKMAKLREEIAVQKAKETELNKTIHITEETMRAKQMLATMSHEIRSPLTGVVSMAEILATTRLDKEQRQLLDVMLSSGDLVLQLINDILDLSKVESGVMKLESTKFRPREVVKHVLQTAAASLQKELTLEGRVAENVPIEIFGDVLRIRQILTNLISNAIKFTHKGKVGINLQVVSEQYSPGLLPGNSAFKSQRLTKANSSEPQNCDMESSRSQKFHEDLEECNNLTESVVDDDVENTSELNDSVVWLRCDVYDTGIGIPEKALPSLFKKYMQASADHARKYGGTGLGLAICKQLVELMGGNLTVTSKEHHGSTFTFVLPCKVPTNREHSDDSDEVGSISDDEVIADANSDEINGSFLFKPRSIGALFSSGECVTRMSKTFYRNTVDESDSFCSQDTTSSKSSISDATYLAADMQNAQENLQHEAHKIEVMNTIHECRDDYTCSEDSNRTEGISSEHCAIICEGEVNTSNNSCHMHENGCPDCPSTSNGCIEEKKIDSAPKILLVEDNKINVMVAQSMIKRLGHSIEIVSNGLEAIRAVQSSHYDLILMDVCMPVMDGLQATRLIRSYEEHGYWDPSVSIGSNHNMMACSHSRGIVSNGGQHRKRTPIIAMTANAISESAEVCLANGMDSFVSKPVTFQKLKQCLQGYLPC